MASSAHRRQVFLFLAAILLPCAALVVFGVRLLVQERELAEARLDEERRSVTRQLRTELASRLELVALQQAGALAARPGRLAARRYGDSAVALVASVSSGRLALPWEHDPGPARSRDLLVQVPFATILARAEGAEFSSERPSEALGLYREALRAARDPVQAAQARLSQARVLAKTGRAAEAGAEYRRLAAVSPDVVDQHGIAFSLYASAQLLGAGADAAETVRQALSSAFFVDKWLAPEALHLIHSLAARLPVPAAHDAGTGGGESLTVSVSRELERTERVLALARDFAGLGVAHRSHESRFPRNRWILYGSPAWLVGAAPAPGEGPSVVVAIDAATVFAAVEAGAADPGGILRGIESAATAEADDELLGADFPGLVVRFEQADGGPPGAWTAGRWFYLAGLALVIGVTLFGAYLLWRDVRREVQVAELRSRFVSAVSHELKTPLTAIRMFAETLQMGRSTDHRTRSEYLETIVSESERLTRLLNNVLDFSKIERGDKSYRREACCLADIVRSTARAMEYPLRQQQFALNVEIEDGLRRARVDRDAIEQAILNLLDNAMKYSGDSRAVSLRLASQDGEAVISVSDRGVGIAPDEQGRIFERFYRARGPDEGRVPGTGLGLTLVQHIAQAHRGRVTVRSDLGRGSTFSLHLPWEEDQP